MGGVNHSPTDNSVGVRRNSGYGVTVTACDAVENVSSNPGAEADTVVVPP